MLSPLLDPPLPRRASPRWVCTREHTLNPSLTLSHPCSGGGGTAPSGPQLLDPPMVPAVVGALDPRSTPAPTLEHMVPGGIGTPGPGSTPPPGAPPLWFRSALIRP